jgi:lipopolysaccharide transport system permease protein
MAQSAEAVRPAYRPVRSGFIETITSTISDVLTRRRLISYLVRADLQKKGANTLLGNVWWVVDPLLTMVVYVVLVSVILRSTREAYPLFIFCAILPWKWFATSISGGVTSVTTRERIIKQVNFPKVVLPVADVVSGVVSFGFGLIPLVALVLIFYSSHLSAWMLLIPVIAAVQFVLTLGLTIVAAGITVFFRDLGQVTGHLLRIWFYLSPALYGAEQIESLARNHPQLFAIYNLNPFAGLFESYRNVIYYGRPPEWTLLGVVLVESLIVLVIAVVVFRRLEPSFAKVI